MKTQKCCAHCPGKPVLSGSNKTHDCCLPKYVTGNLRISSLRKQTSGSSGGERRAMSRAVSPIPDEPTSRYDQFALAKKLHAENLEHQPLPDRVDDSLFKDPKAHESCRQLPRGKCTCVDEHDRTIEMKTHRYGPVLGCKKPETRMDLAICWETPIDPYYEPRRPTHIDGSEGGSAPAIFALVQHTPNSTKACIRSEPTQLENSEAAHSSDCHGDIQEMGTRTRNIQEEEEAEESKKNKGESGCCCECLCRKLNRVALSKRGHERRSRSERSQRKCVACAEKERRDDPRLIKSAVGLALGLEKTERKPRKNCLPSKATVPRPKTPFARRSFCIDTLSPPFSVVNGCRDADYPEHWRLMSIYQQSYRNPQKRRTTFHY